MIKEIIAIGATVEEAKEAACQQLGVETYDDRIDFEIIEMQSKKVLGLFGGRPAKVKVILKETPSEAAFEYVKNIIRLMGLEQIEMNMKEEDNAVVIDIEGEDVGFIIGRRGETLDALQYLACLAANRIDSSYSRVVINTGDYREKREKTLESLGRRLAIKAAKTGRKSSLEPMNPYERRIIHTSVQKVNGATSWSEGENINRHVVIGPDGKSNFSRDNRGRGRRPYNGNKRGGSSKASSSKPDPNRKPLNEGGEYGLYGRIDKK